MPASYSLDLRKKVIEYVNKANGCHRASIKFQMGAHFGMSAHGALYWLRKLDSAIKKAFTYVEANQEKRDA